jgi:rod shape-determining protein MreC
VTSGLDGTYPPGLPVAKVVRVDKQADTAFARVICLPVAPVRGARQLLVLHYQNNALPRPADEPDAASAAKDAKAKKGAKGAEKPAAKPADKGLADKGATDRNAKTAASEPAAAARPAAEKKAASEKKPPPEKSARQPAAQGSKP